jgi:hypothetical protein
MHNQTRINHNAKRTTSRLIAHRGERRDCNPRGAHLFGVAAWFSFIGYLARP